jgi:hypothetical protein
MTRRPVAVALVALLALALYLGFYFGTSASAPRLSSYQTGYSFALDHFSPPYGRDMTICVHPRHDRSHGWKSGCVAGLGVQDGATP